MQASQRNAVPSGEEPVEVTAIAHRPADNPRFREVPESVAFTLRFPSGVLAHYDCSFGSPVSRRYRVHCAEGVIDMDPAFDYRGLRLRVKQTKGHGGEQAWRSGASRTNSLDQLLFARRAYMP